MTFKKLFLMAMGITAWSTDVTGAWIVNSGGDFVGTRFRFAQSGERLSGVWVAGANQVAFTGVVQTDSVEFRVALGNGLEAWFEGTIEGQATMEGTYRVGRGRAISWKAKRER